MFKKPTLECKKSTYLSFFLTYIHLHIQWRLAMSKPNPINIENRMYREEFTRKKCKTAILLYCFHTAGVLQIFMLYNLLGPAISLYRKSKIIVKRKPNYEIGWFHNWPMIIHIDSMPSTLHTMIQSLSGWKGLKISYREILLIPLYILFSMYICHL